MRRGISLADWEQDAAFGGPLLEESALAYEELQEEKTQRRRHWTSWSPRKAAI